MGYIALDVGCLECHEPTDLIGAFDSIDEAKAAAQQAANWPLEWEDDDPTGEGAWGTRTRYAIFDLSLPNAVSVGRAQRRPSQ